MKERLFHLRKAVLNLSRAKFGEPIGMSDSEIKNIETGLTQLKDSKISLICKEYNVNETWLRTGTGDMFNPKTRGEEIGAIVKSAARHDPEQAAAFMQSLVSDLSDAEIVLLYEIFRRHFPGAEKKPSPSGEGGTAKP